MYLETWSTYSPWVKLDVQLTARFCFQRAPTTDTTLWVIEPHLAQTRSIVGQASSSKIMWNKSTAQSVAIVESAQNKKVQSSRLWLLLTNQKQKQKSTL